MQYSTKKEISTLLHNLSVDTLKYIRHNLGISRECLAEILDVHPNTITNRERGVGSFDAVDLLIMRRLLSEDSVYLQRVRNGRCVVHITRDDVYKLLNLDLKNRPPSIRRNKRSYIFKDNS